MALIDNILNGVRSKDIANWEDAFGHIVFGDKKWSNLLWQDSKLGRSLLYDTIEVYDYPRKEKVYVAAYSAMPFAHHTGKASIFVAPFTYNNLIKRFDKYNLNWTGIFDFSNFDNNLNRIFEGLKVNDDDVIAFIKERPMWDSYHWRNESLRQKPIS